MGRLPIPMVGSPGNSESTSFSRLSGSLSAAKRRMDSTLRQAAGQVESNSPQKLGVGGQLRMRDALLLELPEDVVVDQVLARDRRFGQQR